MSRVLYMTRVGLRRSLVRDGTNDFSGVGGILGSSPRHHSGTSCVQARKPRSLFSCREQLRENAIRASPQQKGRKDTPPLFRGRVGPPPDIMSPPAGEIRS